MMLFLVTTFWNLLLFAHFPDSLFYYTLIVLFLKPNALAASYTEHVPHDQLLMVSTTDTRGEGSSPPHPNSDSNRGYTSSDSNYQQQYPQHRQQWDNYFLYYAGTMQFFTWIPELLGQNHMCYHWLRVSGISKIMHCGILINTLYFALCAWATIEAHGWLCHLCLSP